jgi:hypothetical protein
VPLPHHPEEDTVTDHVIAAIDAALTDYTVSTDAMRWTPDADAPEFASGGYIPGPDATEAWGDLTIQRHPVEALYGEDDTIDGPIEFASWDAASLNRISPPTGPIYICAPPGA